MTLRVSGKNLDIGEALRQHVLEKVEATVARYFSGSVGGHVVMTREGSGYRSDCTLAFELGTELARRGPGAGTLPLLRAGGRQDRKPLAPLQDPPQRPCRRRLRRMRGARLRTILSNCRTRKTKNPSGGFDPVVVAEGTEDLKSLSVASAVAELDLTGAPVIVFQHAGSGRVNVVYRRRDGAIGWLDPQAPREPPRAA